MVLAGGVSAGADDGAVIVVDDKAAQHEERRHPEAGRRRNPVRDRGEARLGDIDVRTSVSGRDTQGGYEAQSCERRKNLHFS